jgi:hypothetical protein
MDEPQRLRAIVELLLVGRVGNDTPGERVARAERAKRNRETVVRAAGVRPSAEGA